METVDALFPELGTSFSRNSSFALHCVNHDVSPINYAKYVVGINEERKRGICSDAGDIAMSSYRVNHGDLPELRTDFIHEYLTGDFEFAINGARACLRNADNLWIRLLNGYSREDHLNFASVLAGRARESIGRASLFAPKDFHFPLNYDGLLEEVDRFDRRLFFAREFSGDYNLLFSLDDSIRNAVAGEDYERAAMLRDEMERVRGDSSISDKLL